MNDPIEPKEVEFLEERDLLSLAKLNKSPLQQTFEQSILLPLIRRLSWHERTRPQPAFRAVTHINEKPVEVLVMVVTFATAIMMLISPLWILASLTTLSQKLGVITAFVLLFLTVLNWVTLSRPFEILVATAG